MKLALTIVLLVGCEPETFDLVGLRDAASDTGVEDTGVEDTGVTDTGTADVGFPDMGFPDTGTPDMGTPDTGVECVCRIMGCSIDDDCRAILRSTCDMASGFCTDALGTCATAADCTEPGSWSCTMNPTSEAACR